MVLVPEYILLDGARSYIARPRRNRKCLSGPPLGRSWSYMVGRSVGLSKIYPIQSVLFVLFPIYIIFDLHWARSNRMRDILSAPPLDHSCSHLCWAGGLAYRKYTLSNRVCSFQCTVCLIFFMELGPTGTEISSPSTFGPLLVLRSAGGWDCSKTYYITWILIIPIYIMLDFRKAR